MWDVSALAFIDGLLNLYISNTGPYARLFFSWKKTTFESKFGGTGVLVS